MSGLSYGLLVAAIGLVIVFTVLVILIVVISLLTGLFHKFTGKKPEAAPVSQPAPETAAAPVAAESEDVIDPELIAVISAAVAAFEQNNSFVVRRVRRVPAWKQAAINEMVTRF